MRRSDATPPQPRGFTFVEILAAMLFMALVIPVAMEGIMLANRVGQGAMRQREAGELAERILNEAVVTESWRNGNQSGENDDYPGFRWELTNAPWDIDAMQLIEVRVEYPVQGTIQSLRLTTLVDPVELVDDTLSGSTDMAP
jgi:hypothetical protein